VIGLLPVVLLTVAATLELSVGDTRAVQGSKVSVTFVRVVNDSRCPKGVTCVWEGDAAIELRVTPDGGEAETVQLHANPRTVKDVVLHGVRVTLERLEPYPEEGRAINSRDYRAVLAITHE
jgi:hypothetical protein